MSEATKKLRVGVIGLGMGRAHIKGWQEHPHVEVVALADPDSARLTTVGEEFSVACRYASAEEMLATERLDVVSV
ncbi:MAG: Gfo/Idh/MocA family oxidoreductase, partial [Rhodoferax sp.]